MDQSYSATSLTDSDCASTTSAKSKRSHDSSTFSEENSQEGATSKKKCIGNSALNITQLFQQKLGSANTPHQKTTSSNQAILVTSISGARIFNHYKTLTNALHASFFQKGLVDNTLRILGRGETCRFEAEGDVLKNALNVALGHGYRSIDTAFGYFNEHFIGEVLQEWFSQGKLKREDVFITTKLPLCGNRQENVEKYLKLSLKNLRLDYVDLFLIHCPVSFYEGKDEFDIYPKSPNGEFMFDFKTSLESTWKGMEIQVDDGRTKSIGLSNFNFAQIERILKVARTPPAVIQVEAHAYLQQGPLLDQCNKHGIEVCAYAPLAAPFRDVKNSMDFKLIENPTVIDIANHRGKSPSQVLLKFLLQRGFIILPKSVTPKSIKENFELFNFDLEEKEMKRISALDQKGKFRIYHCKDRFQGIEKHREYPF